MSPAPHPTHARASFSISWNLGAIIEKNKGKCEVFYAPFDVRFPKQGENADNKIDTVVQPDICVICDLSKINYYEISNIVTSFIKKKYYICRMCICPF